MCSPPGRAACWCSRPDGTLLGRILTGVPTANVAWGEDGSTLFITANHRVLRLRTRTQGMPLPRG